MATLSLVGCGSDSGTEPEVVGNNPWFVPDAGPGDSGVVYSGGIDAGINAGPTATNAYGLPIEAILYSWEQNQRGPILAFESTTYLVLRDGTVREVAPPGTLKTFNLQSDRASNPAKWGRWQRTEGTYRVMIGSNPSYEEPSNQWTFEPAKPGEYLSGVWTKEGGSATFAVVSSWSTTFAFASDGRFETSGFSSIIGSLPPVGTMPGVGGSSAASSPVRRGRYTLNGYVITLAYEDGETIDLLFSASPERGMLFIGDIDLFAED